MGPHFFTSPMKQAPTFLQSLGDDERARLLRTKYTASQGRTMVGHRGGLLPLAEDVPWLQLQVHCWPWDLADSGPRPPPLPPGHAKGRAAAAPCRHGTALFTLCWLHTRWRVTQGRFHTVVLLACSCCAQQSRVEPSLLTRSLHALPAASRMSMVLPLPRTWWHSGCVHAH